MRAPQQKDLITNRWRGVKAPRTDEVRDIHIPLVAYIRLMIKRDVLFWHTPNGGLRNKREAAKLKAMGVRPGVSDLIFIRRATWSLDCLPEIFCLELKAPNGKQNDNQIAFGKEMSGIAGDGCYAIADSTDRAIEILEKRGWLRPRQAAARP